MSLLDDIRMVWYVLWCHTHITTTILGMIYGTALDETLWLVPAPSADLQTECKTPDRTPDGRWWAAAPRRPRHSSPPSPGCALIYPKHRHTTAPPHAERFVLTAGSTVKGSHGTDLWGDTRRDQQTVGRDGGRGPRIHHDAAPDPGPELLAAVCQAPVWRVGALQSRCQQRHAH